MKTCCMCHKELPASSFKNNARRKDGLQSQCIDCQRAYRREHYKRNKKKYLAKARKWQEDFVRWWKEYKSQFSCERCGEAHPACIQFHHPNQDKERCVSEWVTAGSRERLLTELKRCVPICANCHFKEHWQV